MDKFIFSQEFVLLSYHSLGLTGGYAKGKKKVTNWAFGRNNLRTFSIARKSMLERSNGWS